MCFPLDDETQASDAEAHVTSENVSDSSLIERIVEGDGTAVGLLYDRHAKALFPIAIRILRDRAEAEDILHDAFVSLVDRANQFSEARGTVGAWLVTMIRNLSIDRMRRRDRRGTIDRTQLAHELPQYEASPASRTSHAQESERVRIAISTLPPAQRETLEKAFFEGLSYPEIAERENVPLGTIKSRAARALATLRALLEADGIADDE